MKKHTIELLVGIFVVVGSIAMAYLAISLGNVGIFAKRGYTVYAVFDTTSGLQHGANVDIAGVEIGRVEGIKLKDYASRVEMSIKPEVKIPDDSIFSIRTTGLIGEKFVKVVPGGSEEWLKDGATVYDTESSVSIEELISKYIYSLK
ncbi:MAG: outer membrane lipid asymmetry maintenance protein MlaD [Thermodesulfobacteriota bacterium]|nr:MAG: outer membrane lipid asymmetry maintenance protein MlaD [Thermodesulfobacteriota bacterium]